MKKQDEETKRIYFEKEFKLGVLVQSQEAFLKAFKSVKGFARSWDIAEKVIQPMTRINKQYQESMNELVKKYGEHIEGDNYKIDRVSNPEKWDNYVKDVTALDNENITVTLTVIEKSELRDDNDLNSLQIGLLLDNGIFVSEEKPKIEKQKAKNKTK